MLAVDVLALVVRAAAGGDWGHDFEEACEVAETRRAVRLVSRAWCAAHDEAGRRRWLPPFARTREGLGAALSALAPRPEAAVGWCCGQGGEEPLVVLHQAAALGLVGVVQALGALPQTRGPDARALGAAITEGRVGAAGSCLWRSGGPVAEARPWHREALRAAAAAGHVDVMLLLAGPPWALGQADALAADALGSAARCGRADVVRALGGPPWSLAEADGAPVLVALLAAVHGEHVDVVRAFAAPPWSLPRRGVDAPARGAAVAAAAARSAHGADLLAVFSAPPWAFGPDDARAGRALSAAAGAGCVAAIRALGAPPWSLGPADARAAGALAAAAASWRPNAVRALAEPPWSLGRDDARALRSDTIACGEVRALLGGAPWFRDDIADDPGPAALANWFRRDCACAALVVSVPHREVRFSIALPPPAADGDGGG